MAYEVYAKDCINWWKAQVGKPCGKTNEYSAYMDKYKFYNYPKNGSANSCAIFYDTAIMKTMSPEANANAGRAILCEPNVDNCGAGCTQKVQYYKDAGRYYTKTKDAQSGDEVFFKRSDGAIYHTGALVDWSDVKKELYVVEGNTNGGMVAQKTYKYGDSKIAGFGRPKWTGWERPKTTEPVKDEKPTEPVKDEKPTEPVKDENPVETKPAEPSYTEYKVKTNTGVALRIRTSPRTSSVQIGYIPNGKKCKVFSIENGWAKVEYNGTKGYSYAKYLKKV